VPDSDPIARFRVPAILGMAHFRSGEMVEAEQHFGRGIDIAMEAGLSAAALPFFCNLAETQIAQGRLHEAMLTCERALDLGTVEGERSFGTGFVGIETAKILYEWDDLQAAERQLVEGLDLLAQGGIGESFGSAHAVLAQVRQATGDVDGALDAARQAVESARRDGIPRLLFLAQAYRARIWLALGRKEAAGWAREYRQAGETEYLRAFEDLTLARVLLAEKRPAEALDLLDPMLSSASESGRTGSVIEIQALRALALHAENEQERALEAVQQALALAEPEGYVRTFVDLDQPMVALLKGAGVRGIAPQYVSRLLAAFPQDTAQPTLERQPLVEPLTGREIEVLRLLAERLSNREIGRRLFISVPTVKSHTRSIYGKLGVHDREEAVARARSLAILPPG
jgi:LuxR family maltose regulon positive regulatory protein